MSDFKDLYRNAIVDHFKKPRNYHMIEQANRKAEGNNPLCGDKFSIFLRIDNGVISDIGFTGTGCAIATASASMMTESLRGKAETQARAMLAQFTDLLTGSSDSREVLSLGTLSVFKGVRGYPARVKCALLAWDILLSALDENQETLETE